MRRVATIFALLFAGLAVAATALPAQARQHEHAGSHGGRFDYYLLSLSWAPSYCLTHADNSEECGGHGFGFVLHGLWPQNRDGTWPHDCASDRTPSARTVERALAFMPSRALIGHEWRMHGACTGLDPERYFELADHAFAAVTIPPALRAPQIAPQLSAAGLKDAFLRANPALGPGSLSVVCHDGAELVEVHVCLDRQTLAPQPCGGRMRDRCRSGTLRIPAAR